MKNLALDYFRKQPSYCLMVAPKVRDMVTRLWLEGNGLRTVAETILKSDLGKQSIIRYKQYVANVTAVTEDFINSDENTRSIIMGFLSYIEEIYNELEYKRNGLAELSWSAFCAARGYAHDDNTYQATNEYLDTWCGSVDEEAAFIAAGVEPY